MPPKKKTIAELPFLDPSSDAASDDSDGGFLKKLFRLEDDEAAQELSAVIAAGAVQNINAPDFHVFGENTTLLNLVALEGRLRCMEVLVAAGADLNAASESGHTALHLATLSHDQGGTGRFGASCVKVLLSAGADHEIRTKRGNTALDLASGRVARMLKDPAGTIASARNEAEARAASKSTLELEVGLKKAAASCDEAALKELIDAGVDVNVQSYQEDETALGIVCGARLDKEAKKDHKRRERCVDLLLAAGANPNINGSFRKTPLHWNAWDTPKSQGKISITRKLVAAGAQINIGDENGYPPHM